MRYGEAGQSHLLPFLGAAALFAALTIMAHSVCLLYTSPSPRDCS